MEEDIENNSETSKLEQLSNLSSSTEMEQDTRETNLRRSKRLTITNQKSDWITRYHLNTGKTVKGLNDRESTITLENNRESDESPRY